MAPIGERLEVAGTKRGELEVRLSRELVSLLSEQLYTSPLKAIEELVVNAFDADAKTCRVKLPDRLDEAAEHPILVFDDGVGMDVEGLRDLWHIGHSSKRDEEIQKRRQRKQIGKFGIGKLATYAIARHVTYVSKTADGPVLAATLDYEEFNSDPTGGGETVGLDVVELSEEVLRGDDELTTVVEAVGVRFDDLIAQEAHWTMVLLEDFKPKIRELERGRLRWVLSTAMPLAADFTLFLDDREVRSSKESYEELLRFKVADLPEGRLKDLSTATGELWASDGEALTSPTFPEGIRGEVLVTVRTLTTGKSADLRRSHGFFVRVRGRLVNIEDPLFGLTPLSHQTFNRFRAFAPARHPPPMRFRFRQRDPGLRRRFG